MAKLASSSANITNYAITIDDTSPALTYRPFADSFGEPNRTGGWSPGPSTGEANGITLHVTSTSGASLSFRWNGTAAALYGSFSSSSSQPPPTVPYSVSLDGTATTNYVSDLSSRSDPSTSILASFTNLTNDEHTIELTMEVLDNDNDDNILLEFDRAVITSALPDQSMQQFSDVTLATDTLPDNSISFQGQWSFVSNLLPSQNVSFHTSTNLGDSASVSFNGTSVTLAGLTTPHSGAYNISLDNGLPETFSARSSSNLTSPTLLFFRTGLDPGVVHRLDIVNAGEQADDQGSLLIVGSVNVTTVEQNGSGTAPVGSMSSSSLHKGAIAALVVGIVVAIAVLVVLSACYIRRRRRDKQRKENFIVNPRISSRRLSFMRFPRRSQQVDLEKASHKDDPSRGSADADIVDITGRKEDEEDEDEEAHETSMLQLPRPEGGSRHGSQNSDGSYSISLPELPGRGHVRVRSNEDSPPPTQRHTSGSPSLRIPSLQSPAFIPPSSPRSPRPRGPREMRSSNLVATREGPQGILLRELQSPTLDVPVNVQDDGRLTATGASTSQPPTPLRVNFDDVDVRPQRRSRTRSAMSGISLPASLRQAFSWAQGRSSEVPAETQPQTQDAEPRSFNRYSFLDMESSASQSLSSGSRSARNSRSASTRGSSKSRQATDSSEAGGRTSSDIPPVPHDPRASLGLSMIMAGGPTSSRPSLSPDISLQAVPLPPISVPEPRIGAEDVPQSVHPTDLAELLPSPTDSIPLTVSDIHFRHSTQSSVSAADSQNNTYLSPSHRTAHPPLPTPPLVPSVPSSIPSTPQPDTRPYIVQKLVGSPSAGPGPSTPYSTPRLSGSSGPSGPRSSPPARRSHTVGPSFSSVMYSRPSMSRLSKGKDPQ